MGRPRAFTGKVVMLRGKSIGQVGTIGSGGLGGSKLSNANYVVHNSDAAESHNVAGAFSLLLAMVTVPLDLPAFINAEAPNGRMHGVGVTFVPIAATNQDKSIYGAVTRRQCSWTFTI
jgi:hypothetical protein